MKIKLVSLEDGITSCGFRKMAAFAGRVNPETEACYISTAQYRSIRNAVKGTTGNSGADFGPDQIDEIVSGLAGAELVGFSSMTGYADLTRRIITRVREVSPESLVIWGGIHPIIHPEDAILADVDGICVGEGEFAFEELLAALSEGRDHTGTRNFWFKRGEEVKKNHFRPLMSVPEMETLPYPQYGQGELLYRPGQGFKPMKTGDFLANDGLGYTTLWSIGCPFHCEFCGNTKFIANDPKYKKIRHPSAEYIVGEVKAARTRFPHISQVSFHDDSFMAISYADIERFAELWKAELDIPFAVYGVIPNYVKRDKFEILTWAGMNRVRMGIQSGSQEILDFYRRPTPPEKIMAAGEVIASFSPKYHIPPAYDIIMDNPIETRENVIETLELLYEMPRPYTLFIYSLRVIPNTGLERAMRERGIDIEEISAAYQMIPPRVANLLLYLLALFRPPRRVFDFLLRHVESSATPQPEYPRIGLVLRTAYLAKRAFDHARFMDFSITTGWSGWIAWRLGIVDLWQRKLKRRHPRPAPPVRVHSPGVARAPRATPSAGVSPQPAPSVNTGA
ncbi:MAG: anaerobic magnesium-protoporphyrin monomethyl ester cyclase [Solirubrobacteraceae bacterium]|nr:anaerobic magnesium-protoporphyrin monomethyl ester cyclase [Solirubrobacteraceae bacterium]